MFCSLCQEIIKNFVVRREMRRTAKKKVRVDSQQFNHSPLLESVQISARNGCQICSMLCLYFEVESENAGHIPNEKPNLKYELYVEATSGAIFFSWDRKLTIGYAYLRVVREKDIAACLSDGSLDSYSEASAASGSWPVISTWLSQCLNQHSQCNETLQSNQWWPTRLLQIQEPDRSSDVRLIETTETTPTGPYLTLSHRWGKARFRKLTNDTLNELKAGFAASALPKTFRDAITVAKRLQVYYLWIDSLCIIQDSTEDWNKEASQMSAVYQHGYCNIAATGALDSTIGLFLDRNSPLKTSCKVEIPLREDPCCRETWYIVDDKLWGHSIDQSPLVSRAWVVQERLLAKRVLHFTKHQIFWECAEKTACEVFPIRFFYSDSTEIKDVLPRKISLDDSTKRHYLSISKYGRHPIYSGEQIWANILSCYTSANLTKPEDKEAALIGIVKFLEAQFSDQYKVGLWTGSLPSQLAWRPCGSTPSRADKPPYRAPSWCVVINISGMAWATFRFAVADVKQLEVIRNGDFPLSPITAGFIELSGIILRLRLRIPSDSYSDPDKPQFEAERDGKLVLEVELDYLEDESLSKDSIWCTLLHVEHRWYEWKPSEKEGSIHGDALVLRRSVQGTYERIGISRVWDDDVFRLLSKKQRAMLKREIRQVEHPYLHKTFSRISLRGRKSKDVQDTWEDDPEEQTITII